MSFNSITQEDLIRARNMLYTTTTTLSGFQSYSPTETREIEIRYKGYKVIIRKSVEVTMSDSYLAGIIYSEIQEVFMNFPNRPWSRVEEGNDLNSINNNQESGDKLIERFGANFE